ncbi:MAG: hypothetical protein LBC62_03740, partial [Treponema sp.]|nr:hypothetical protein [Treponema sp.]
VNTKGALAAGMCANISSYTPGSVDDSNLIGAAADMLDRLSNQANNLMNWFDTAEDSGAARAATFTALKGYETNIKNITYDALRLAEYAPVAGIVDNILDEIFGADMTARQDFDKYFNAYTKGQYMWHRDWGTEGANASAALNTAGAEYSGLISEIGLAGNDELVDDGRGNMIPIGTNHDAVLAGMMAQMKTRVVAALGLTDVTNADAMAEALLTQIAQDHQEFTAFVEDMTKQGMFAGRTADLFRTHQYIAQSQTQSATKLAGIKQ